MATKAPRPSFLARRLYFLRRRLILWLAGSDSVVANIHQVGGAIFLRGRAIAGGEWVIAETPPEGSVVTQADLAQGIRMIPPAQWT